MSEEWDFEEPQAVRIEREKAEMWKRWGRFRFLEVRKAACLLTDSEPSTYRNSRILPNETDVMEELICQCIITGELEALKLYTFDEDTGEPLIVDNSRHADLRRVHPHYTTITTTNLAEWAEREGILHGWKLPNATKTAPAKTPAVEYPDELQAAIDAFHAVKADPEACRGKTPRQAIAEWLEANRQGLSGKARDRVATVANWKPEGGAPATPTGLGSTE